LKGRQVAELPVERMRAFQCEYFAPVFLFQDDEGSVETMAVRLRKHSQQVLSGMNRGDDFRCWRSHRRADAEIRLLVDLGPENFSDMVDRVQPDARNGEDADDFLRLNALVRAFGGHDGCPLRSVLSE
jgi:hypothetical protein